MPWKQSGPMDERLRFIAAYQSDKWSMSELCRHHGISRRIGYKIVRRYQEEGVDGLKDRSRAPHTSPHRTSAEVEDILLNARRARPHWGPRKILAWLSRRQPAFADLLPAASTVGDLYRRNGLTQQRRRRALKAEHIPAGKLETDNPNEVWTADFKGEFRLGNGLYCYPFTLADAHSRFLLSCQAESSTNHRGVKQALLTAFRTHGLPEAIRTDNGTPFVGHGATGLTQLSVWWIKLGIRHQRIAKSRPDQNGRHERMHRTLKAEATRPPEKTFLSQQIRFDGFRQEFNLDRPHEALAQCTPASCYHCSDRSYPEQLPAPEYPGHAELRTVDSGGCFRFNGYRLFIAHPLAGELLALEEIDNDLWSVRFYNQELGRITTCQQQPELNVLPMSPV